MDSNWTSSLRHSRMVWHARLCSRARARARALSLSLSLDRSIAPFLTRSLCLSLLLSLPPPLSLSPSHAPVWDSALVQEAYDIRTKFYGHQSGLEFATLRSCGLLISRCLIPSLIKPLSLSLSLAFSISVSRSPFLFLAR